MTSGERLNLRRLAGVDETLLDLAPEERPHYTRLGGVVLATAAVAAFSMCLALSEIFGEFSAWLLGPALAWGVIICNLDAWIVSSMHGTRWRARAWIVLPRVLLAVVFGILIAEPIVLKVFQTAIEQRIADDRQDDLLRFQTHLKLCNPTDGSPLGARLEQRARGRLEAQCQDGVINVKDVSSPTALTAQLAAVRAQRRAVAHTIHVSDGKQAHLDAVARKECNGSDGEGLSGKFGVGPNCTQNRGDADDFRTTSDRATLVDKRNTLDTKITDLANARKLAAQSYETAVNAAVAAKVADRRAQQKKIGLLERLEALHDLVQTNFYVGAAEWFVRLFFILFDCLPLIVKVMGGVKTYDENLEKHLSSIERRYESETLTQESIIVGAFEQERYRVDEERRRERDEINSVTRLRNAEREVEIDAMIDDLTQRALRRQGVDEDVAAHFGSARQDQKDEDEDEDPRAAVGPAPP